MQIQLENTVYLLSKHFLRDFNFGGVGQWLKKFSTPLDARIDAKHDTTFKSRRSDLVIYHNRVGVDEFFNTPTKERETEKSIINGISLTYR